MASHGVGIIQYNPLPPSSNLKPSGELKTKPLPKEVALRRNTEDGWVLPETVRKEVRRNGAHVLYNASHQTPPKPNRKTSKTRWLIPELLQGHGQVCGEKSGLFLKVRSKRQTEQVVPVLASMCAGGRLNLWCTE